MQSSITAAEVFEVFLPPDPESEVSLIQASLM
jgi:hypothetical protein